MLEFLRYKLGELVACVLPWRLAYLVSELFANLHFILSKIDKRAVESNLKCILPECSEADLQKKAKEVFINFGYYLVEFFRFSKIDKAYIENHFTVVGKEHLDSALQKQKGVIILTAHIGNWELAGMALCLMGYPIIAIALDHANKRVNDFFIKRRRSKGMEVVSLGIAVKHCFKGLRKNKIVAVLGDRDFSHSSYAVDFFGKTKNIPRGPAVLAQKTGAPIVPAFVTRRGLNKFQVECFPAIDVSKDKDEIEIVKSYSKIIEDQIRKYSSQWLLFREFWRE